MAKHLTPEEMPDLSNVRTAMDATLADLLRDWAKLTAAQKEQLIASVAAAIDAGNFASLADLDVSSTDAAQALLESMIQAASTATDQVVNEGADQGVTITPRDPDRGTLSGVAIVTAALLARELAISAARAAMRANGAGAGRQGILDDVRSALDDLSDASAVKQLGGALHGAVNATRIAVLQDGPIGSLYAYELNDHNTCKYCRKVNGRFLGTTEEMDQVLRSYPDGAYGGYIDCLGGINCRGTIFGVWREGTEEE